MIAFTSILCATDFSEASRPALSYAAALARWYGARLHVLHVMSPVDELAVAAGGGHLVDRQPPVSPDAAERELARLLDEVGASGATTEVDEGPARLHEVIARSARDCGADLLAMGTHGRGGFNRLLLGSVAEKVLRIAPCPVLTVPPSASATTAEAVSFKRILCPIDHSPSSLRALGYALGLAREAGGSVTLLTALEYLDPEEPCEHVDFDVRRHRQHFIEHARERLHALVEGEDTTWCDVEEVVTIGRAYKMVLDHASKWPADLIVMGAQGTGGLELMLYGSNTQHVLRAATCPVLTVRADQSGSPPARGR